MAKLPGVQINRPLALPGRDARSEVIKAGQRFNVADEAYKLGHAVAKVKTDNDVMLASADWQQSVIDFQKDVADKAYATPDELRDMGIADSVDMNDGNGNEMESVPKWKWYTAALDKHMDGAIEAAGGRIMAPNARAEWEQGARQVSNNELRRSVAESGEMAIKSEYDQTVAEYKLAVSARHFDKAREILSKSPILNMDPAAKSLLANELDQIEEKSLIYEQFESNDPNVIEDTLAKMSTQDYIDNSSLDVESRRSVRQAGYSRLIQINKLANEQKTAAADNLRIDFEVAMYKNPGSVSIEQIDAASAVLGQDHVTALLARQEALNNAGSAYKSPGYLMPAFQAQMFALELGSVPEGSTYEAEIDKMISWVNDQSATQDPETGLVMPVASGPDMAIMRNAIEAARDKPFAQESFRHMEEELRLLILRYSPEDPFGIKPDPETSPVYLEAMTSLRNYMMEEGPTADVAKWKRDNLQGFLQGEARDQLNKLPQNVTNMVVYSADGHIDGGATRTAFYDAFKVAEQNIRVARDQGNDKEVAEAEKALKSLETRIASWDEYVSGIGKNYVR